MSPSWEFLLDTLCRWHLCQEFRAEQFFCFAFYFLVGLEKSLKRSQILQGVSPLPRVPVTREKEHLPV